MKKDGHALIVLFICSLCLVLGIFAGRNIQGDYVFLIENSEVSAENYDQSIELYQLDINSATKSQLQELPGIGEVIAQRIIDYRENNGAFQTLDELQNVEGIGEKKLNAIIELIKVG